MSNDYIFFSPRVVVIILLDSKYILKVEYLFSQCYFVVVLVTFMVVQKKIYTKYLLV